MSKTTGFWSFAALTLAVCTLPSNAMAADVVTMQCTIFNPQETVFQIDSSSGATLPASVAQGALCAQAVADLLGAGYRLQYSYAVSRVVLDCTQLTNETPGTCPGYAGPYYVFTK
jgi:hypothetical protein